MINYAEIIDNLELESVERLLDSLSIPYKDTEAALIMPTACHNVDLDEASWKLYYYKDSHMFYCYTECGAQSIFKFLQHFYETRQIEYNWYDDIYQVILNCSAANLTAPTGVYKSQADNYKPQKARKELPTYSNGLLDVFQKYYPVEWLMDSITPAAMDKYNILFSHSQNKIIIPHYNIKGELVGIRGRALNPYEVECVGKYAPVWIEGKCYSHPLSLNLYGLNKNWENIKRTGTALVFESEKSVLQFESFNEWKNLAVASCGSNLNKFQVDLLLRTCQVKNIVICYDNEELKGEDKYFNKLYNMCKKYTTYCNMSFIYDRNYILPKKASPSDRGEEKFEKLFERRVFVK